MRRRDFGNFAARKSKCPRRFSEIEPEFVHTCIVCAPAEPFTGVFFVRFFAGNVGCLKTLISQKPKNPKISGWGRKNMVP